MHERMNHQDVSVVNVEPSVGQGRVDRHCDGVYVVSRRGEPTRGGQGSWRKLTHRSMILSEVLFPPFCMLASTHPHISCIVRYTNLQEPPRSAG